MEYEKADSLTNEEIEKTFSGFSKEDFRSETPYRIIAGQTDMVTQERLAQIARDIAKQKGIPKGDFDRMLKNVKKLRIDADGNQIATQEVPGLAEMLNGKPDFGKYTVGDRGIWYDGGKGGTVCVCPHPVFPTKRYVNIETGAELLDISYIQDGQWRKIELIDKLDISRAVTVTKLSRFGIVVTSESARDMVNYLAAVDQKNRQIIPKTETVNHLGWVLDRGFSPYIEGVVYDSGGKYADSYAAVCRHGEFEKWREVAREVRESKEHTAARLMMAASVGSIILKWTANQSFITHLWSAESGTGKTIALMLATSIWADPQPGRYMKSLNATKVAYEQMAAFCNNLPLPLDELQTVQKREDFDDTIYMLCEGTGRARGAKDGGLREQTHWLNVILTNGEQPITADSRAGAVNRVVSLETTGQVLPGDKHHLSEIADTIRENYGHAGPMIVDALMKDEHLIFKVSNMYKKFVNELMESTTGKQANYGATLLAADWLIGHVIMEDDSCLTVDDVKQFLAKPEDADTNRKILIWLTDFIVKCSGNFFQADAKDEEELRVNVYGRKSEDGCVYILQDVLKNEMKARRWDFTAFMKWCDRNHYIKTWYTEKDKRWWIKSKFPRSAGENVHAICFLPKAFEAPEEPTDVTEEIEDDCPW